MATTPITDAVDFSTFSDGAAANGGGILTSDTMGTMRRKVNGIINEMQNGTPFAKANIEISTGPILNLTDNSFNISAVTYVSAAADTVEISGNHNNGAIRITFATASDTTDYLLFAQLNKTSSGIATSTSWTHPSYDVHGFNHETTGVTIALRGTYQAGSNNDGDDYWGIRSFFSEWSTGCHNRLSIIIFK